MIDKQSIIADVSDVRSSACEVLRILDRIERCPVCRPLDKSQHIGHCALEDAAKRLERSIERLSLAQYIEAMT